MENPERYHIQKENKIEYKVKNSRILAPNFSNELHTFCSYYSTANLNLKHDNRFYQGVIPTRMPRLLRSLNEYECKKLYPNSNPKNFKEVVDNELVSFINDFLLESESNN